MMFDLQGLNKSFSFAVLWLLFVAPVSLAATQAEWLFDLGRVDLLETHSNLLTVKFHIDRVTIDHPRDFAAELLSLC